MPVTQYIGSRYVPLFADPIEWSASNTYEPLTIVIHEGNSYTSKQAVPKGIDIANEAFWAITGNYNAQVEQYRRETAAIDARVSAIGDSLPENDFDSTNTVKKKIDDSVATLEDSIDTVSDTVNEKIDTVSDTINNKIDNSVATLEDSIDTVSNRLDDAVIETTPPVFTEANAIKFFPNYSRDQIPARRKAVHPALDTEQLQIGAAPINFAQGHQDVAVFMTIVDSWLKKANRFTYGHGELGGIAYYGDYDNPTGVRPASFTDEVSGRYWIDCETFAQMIGSCTSYEMSPYNRGALSPDTILGINPIYNPTSAEAKAYWNYASYPNEATFMQDEANSRRLLSWQFAKALVDAGKFTWVTRSSTDTATPRYYQIPQGAIAFIGSVSNRFMGVGHVSLMLGTYGTKTYIVESVNAVEHYRSISINDIAERDVTLSGFYMPNYYPTLLTGPYLTNSQTDYYQLSFAERNLATNPVQDLAMQPASPGCVFFGIAPYNRSERMSNVHVTLTPNSDYNGYFMEEDAVIEFDINTANAYGCFYPASFNISVELNNTSATNTTYNINLMRVQSDRFARMPTRIGC